MLAFVCACRDRTEALHGRHVSLIVSGDTAGWIVPCGCAAKQSGGLPRRASFIEQCQEDNDVLVLDVGGAVVGTSAYDAVKFAAILRGEVAMGLAVHNIGAAEAAFGAESLRKMARDSGARLVSANVRDADGHAFAEPLRIVDAGQWRIAIVGVLSPRFANGDVQISEPAPAVLAALSAVTDKYDAAVLLAYLPLDELESLARSLPEVDIVVGGPTIQAVEPRLIGPTLLAAATNKGKFLARFDAPARVKSRWSGTIVELDESFPDHPAQLANVRRFNGELKERDFSPAETSFAAALPSSPPSDYQIAGSQSCQQCHAADCGAWRDSGHARAWKTLEAKSSQVDPYCQQCHTTGYGLPGGFVSVARSLEQTNVGCESCHGPSLAHARQPAAATTFIAADQCQRCHDRENSPEFAYDHYWPRIMHGKLTAARKDVP